MQDCGVLGSSAAFHRRFMVGANLALGGVACSNGTLATVAGPASNVSYANAVGIVLDSSPDTYSTTQGNAANTASGFVTCTYHPFQLFRGRYGNAAAAWAALAVGFAGSAILTNSSANSAGLLISDANVGTANLVGGLVVGLTGNNAGIFRKATTHSANTSLAVTVPFDFTIAANDTFLRIPDVGIEGLSLTTDTKDFFRVPQAANLTGTTGITGGTLVFDVLVDGGTCCPQRGEATVNIANTTSPLVEIIGLFADHIYNKLS